MSYKRKSIVTGALILTTASVITRILGFIYRIYMSNTIGAEGMGLYQLVVPVYSLAWSISCSGFTTTVSKLVAAENAKREYGNMGRILKQALLITVAIGTVLSVVTYSAADFIGASILKDSRTIMSLRILAAAFPFMAAASSIRGYFLGLQESVVPAISQVLEQCTRMVIIYFLAGIFIPRGLEYATAAAVIGIFGGETLSFLYVLYSYRVFKIKNKFIKRPSTGSLTMLSTIFAMALPLTANRIVSSLLSTMENILIPQRLQAFGMTQKEAMSAYGQITGMAMPLIFFPSALLVSLSISLVPAISEATAVKNTERISYTVSKSALFTSVIAMCASAIFLVFPKELGMLIYHQDIGDILFLMGIMCPFWYLGITFGGILNGLGQQVFIFRNNLISSVINILFIYFLVPQYGVNAFIVGWFTSLVFVTILEIKKIKSCTNIKFPIVTWFAKPALAAAATGLAVKYLYTHYLFKWFGDIFGLIAGIALLAGMYMTFILLMGCITLDDIRRLHRKKIKI